MCVERCGSPVAVCDALAEALRPLPEDRRDRIERARLALHDAAHASHESRLVQAVARAYRVLRAPEPVDLAAVWYTLSRG